MVKKGKKLSKRQDPSSGESSQHKPVLVDANFSGFIDDLADIEPDEVDAVVETIKKLKLMTWDQIYKTSSKTSGEKRGLNYEPLEQWTASGKKIASIRVTAKCRARVCRDGQYVRFISLHPDHDSAYKQKGGEKL